MRIVNRKEFLSLPEGTVFAKFEPDVFREIEIKGESLANDYCYQGISSAIQCSGSDDFSDKLDLAAEHGIDLPMDFDCQGRDGCFDEDQLFAVYSRVDVGALIARLQEAANPIEGVSFANLVRSEK